jgi:hypothetical protein
MAIVASAGSTVVADQKYSSPTRYLANLAAVISATPAFPGEIVVALDTLIKYRGLEMVAGRWAQAAPKLT